MQSGFDPYREWLDIPDATETPNHYRLLGLRLFEDDPKRISEAVASVSKMLSRRMSGPHRAEAERLINEVDLARGCLSNPAAKGQYDVLLRAELLNEPLVVKPKVTFVSEAPAGMPVPPGKPFAQPASQFKSGFEAAPAPTIPLPPGPPAGASGSSSQATPFAEPAMRVTVEQAAAPLMPPMATMSDAPAPLPPSAFAASTSPSAADDANDMLPPAALPTSYGTPPAAPPTTAIPAAYAIPMAGPVGVPPFAQPLQAQPIYPATPVATVAHGSIPAVPQAVPYTAQPLSYPSAIPAVAEPMMASPIMPSPLMAAPSGLEAPVVPAAPSSWRSRSSSSTALYVALPVIAVIVLLAVVLNNQRATHDTGGGQVTQNSVSAGPREMEQPELPRAGKTSNKSPSTRSSETSVARVEPRQPASMTVAPPLVEPAMPASIQPMPLTPKPEMPATSDPQNDEQVRRSLAEARQALSDKKFELAKVKIESARKSRGSAAVATEVARVDALAQYVEGFWKAVDEQIKGMVVGDQTMLRDKTVGVVEIDSEKLILRVDGENRTYARDDLPIGVAIGLAEAWFNRDDPASKIFLGSIHLAHPKGDRDKARQLWQEAAQQGKQKEVELVMPELEVLPPQVAAMPQDDSLNRKPKASELSAALAEVRQMFQADLDEAASAAAKASVAQKMFQRADQGGDAPAVRFALLSEAATLAAQGSDFDQVSAAIARQAELFTVDAIDARSDVLFEAAKVLEGAEPNESLARAALAAYDEAVLLEQFDQASKLVRIALSAARKSGNGELIKDCSAREKESRELNKK
jgi:hypothetical protein